MKAVKTESIALKTEFIAFRATEKHRQTITEFAQANQMSMSAAIISLIEDLANSRQQKSSAQSLDAERVTVQASK